MSSSKKFRISKTHNSNCNCLEVFNCISFNFYQYLKVIHLKSDCKQQ